MLRSYVAEISKKLQLNGVAFIHHSNLGCYTKLIKVHAFLAQIPMLLSWLVRRGVCEDLESQTRAQSMTASKMLSFARENDLQCVGQELVNWGTKRVLIDCLTTLTRNGSQWSRASRVLKNDSFMREAEQLLRLSRLYDWST